jgi:N-glycosylase/DNA lyase
MTKVKFDPDLHFIKYSSLYEDEKMKQSFLKFLEREKNSSPFLFHFECNLVLEETKMKESYKNLCDKYIFSENENQINIPSHLYKNAKALYETEVSDENFEELYKDLKNLLSDLKNILYQDLYMDAVIFVKLYLK